MAHYALLGVSVEAFDKTGFLRMVAESVGRPGRTIIANHNLHSIYLNHRNPAVRAYCDRAAHIHIDGMPVVWWGRLLGLPLTRAHRVAFLDWQDDFFRQAAEAGWRIFYLGGGATVAGQAAELLRARHSGLHLMAEHGFHAKTGADNEVVLEQIRSFAPHILIVGMGMPLQEQWVLDNWAALPDCLILNQGAAFNYIAGVEAEAPRWWGRLGLEWLYRFVHAPRRLFRRYFVEPWFLLPFMWGDLRRYRLRRGQP